MNFTTVGLNKSQLTVLQQAGAWLTLRNFYLAGGTALAIYFGHRKSVDLDWFTAEKIPDPLILAQQLRDDGLQFETSQTAPGTLYGLVAGVRMSFIEFRYPFLQPLQTWEETGTCLASVDDLACMKLAAIAQRGSRKDFYDVHTLLARHRRLNELLALYQQKFQVSQRSCFGNTPKDENLFLTFRSSCVSFVFTGSSEDREGRSIFITATSARYYTG